MQVSFPSLLEHSYATRCPLLRAFDCIGTTLITMSHIIRAADCIANVGIVFYVDLNNIGAFGQWPSIVYTVFINRILTICKYPVGNPSAVLASSQ